jgi:YHS domain-containing protein
MNKVFFYILTLLLVLTMIACTGEKKQETTMEEMQPGETTTEVDTAKVTCAGCGMIHEKSEMTAYVQDGDTLYFCSDQCKENYLSKQEQSKEM